MQGELSDAQIEEARNILRQGDTRAAEDAFDAVVGKEGRIVALAAYQSGQLAEGRLDYKKALRQYKKAVVLEEDNPEYLYAAGEMARTMAEYKQAEEWLERLLKIREAGKDDAELALVLDRLATLYQNQGRYKEAESLYQRSLAIKEKSLGRDHPSVATTLNNLAGLYQAQGRYAEAEPMYQRSLAIAEESLGREHPHVATALNNLAGLYESQGRYAEAEPMYKRCLVILKDTFPNGHPNIDAGQKNYDYLKKKMSTR